MIEPKSTTSFTQEQTDVAELHIQAAIAGASRGLKCLGDDTTGDAVLIAWGLINNAANLLGAVMDDKSQAAGVYEQLIENGRRYV